MRSRALSKREQQNPVLLEEIKKYSIETKRYASPRITEELRVSSSSILEKINRKLIMVSRIIFC